MQSLYEFLSIDGVQPLVVAGLTWLVVAGYKWAWQIPQDEKVPTKRIMAGVSAVALAAIAELGRVSTVLDAGAYDIGNVVATALPALLVAFGVHNLTKRLLRKKVR